jgi:hypothetical protein
MLGKSGPLEVCALDHRFWRACQACPSIRTVSTRPAPLPDGGTKNQIEHHQLWSLFPGETVKLKCYYLAKCSAKGNPGRVGRLPRRGKREGRWKWGAA